MTMLNNNAAGRILASLDLTAHRDPTAHLDKPHGELSTDRPMHFDDGLSGTHFNLGQDCAGMYSGKTWPFGPAVSVDANASRAIVTLQHNHPGREWSLTVMESPAHELIATGVMPTTEEIVSTLTHVNVPVWFVGVVKALFVVALKHEDTRAEAARHAAEAMRARKAASGMSMLAGQAS